MDLLSRGSIAGLFAVLVIYRIIARIVRNRRYAAEARRLGCLPPPYMPSHPFIPLGFHHVRNSIKADANMTLPQFQVDQWTKMGGRTHLRYFAGTEGIFTCDPQNVQAILATKFRDFGLGSTRIGIFTSVLGDGIFSQDGSAWEHSRALLRPQFARDQISDLNLEEQHVQNIMRALPVKANAGGWTQPMDIQPLFFRLTLDAACEFLFGQSVNSQLAALPENAREGLSSASRLSVSGVQNPVTESEFYGAFDRSQRFLARRGRFADLYWLYWSWEARKDTKSVHRFVDHFVKVALEQRAKNQSSSLSEKDAEKQGDSTVPSTKRKYVFLEALVDEVQDPVELRSQALNILLAGRDTSASLLSYCFLMLSQHPDKLANLRRAILEDFGPYQPSSPYEDGNITFSRLKACSYLQYVLNETLRLFPVVPINSRRSNKATSLPRGGGPDGQSPVFVKPQQQVDYSVYVMHRLEKFWGPDADDFRPERWIGRRPGFEYLPFNAGPRICLGQQLALTEVGYVTVRLLQRFDAIQSMDATVDTTKVLHNLTLTTCPGKGVNIRLHEAPVEA